MKFQGKVPEKSLGGEGVCLVELDEGEERDTLRDDGRVRPLAKEVFNNLFEKRTSITCSIAGGAVSFARMKRERPVRWLEISSVT